MILASAQTKPFDDDIAANILDHCRFIELAAEHGAELILFPEMSLTGYQRERASRVSFESTDPRLDPIVQLVNKYKITVVAGAPVNIGKERHIASFIISPTSNIGLYTKQFLHGGEEEFFSPCFDFNPLLKLGEEKTSFAICADISNPRHAENAALRKTSLYLASIFYTPAGIDEGHIRLSSYAKRHCMKVLMSNYCGSSWGLGAGGNSAYWNEAGSCVEQLDDHSAGLLIVDTQKDHAKKHYL